MVIRVFQILTLFILLLNFACKNKPGAVDSENAGISNDTLPFQYVYDNVTYSIPSPYQISILVKEGNLIFDDKLFQSQLKIESYLTAERRALVLGMVSADIGYLGLYDQRIIALRYLDYTRSILKDLNFSTDKSALLLKKIESNIEHGDSLLNLLSELYQKGNEFLRSNERPDLSALVLAGGWIESFYLLNNLYEISKNSNIFGLILQQQYLLENLIKILRPYYNKSIEFTKLIDNLVEIAYEFEVIDVKYKNNPPFNDDERNETHVTCTFVPILTGSQLDKFFELSKSLRNSSLN